jgi:hypothetical protein
VSAAADGIVTSQAPSSIRRLPPRDVLPLCDADTALASRSTLSNPRSKKGRRLEPAGMTASSRSR